MSDIQESGEEGDVRLILGVSEYWDGVRDGLYLALAEACLESSRSQAISRLKDLVDMAEQQKFQSLQQLLSEIGRGPLETYG
jgi:hypothetical protein